MKPIIDVSAHNGQIDWSAAAHQIDSAIIRIGYRGYGKQGRIVKDARAEENIVGCMGNDIPFSFYYFPTDINVSEALESAKWIIDFCENHLVKPACIWLDSEYSNNQHNGRSDRLSKKERTSLLKVLCYELINNGYYAGIYCSDSWFEDHLEGYKMVDFDSIKFWIARYSKNKPKHPYVAWQYTSAGQIKGIRHYVDLSVRNGEEIDT